MNLYWKVIGLIVFVVVSLGVIGPFLISAKSSELTIAGFGYFICVFLPVGYFLVKSIIKDKTQKKLTRKAKKFFLDA